MSLVLQVSCDKIMDEFGSTCATRTPTRRSEAVVPRSRVRHRRPDTVKPSRLRPAPRGLTMRCDRCGKRRVVHWHTSGFDLCSACPAEIDEEGDDA